MKKESMRISEEEKAKRKRRKETLKEEIERIHGNAKQLEVELKDMGLDDVIHEQEMLTIENAIWSKLMYPKGINVV